MPPLVVVLVCIALALLLWGAVAAHAAWIQARVLSVDMRGFRDEQQRQALVVDNTYTFLLERVFKPKEKQSRDWNDDKLKTQCPDDAEKALTEFSWRKPE